MAKDVKSKERTEKDYGYQPGRKGYQPTSTPASSNPPQGGSGTTPAPSPKPSSQESGAKKS